MTKTEKISEYKNSERPPFFPMMIDMKGKKILIAGGGNVASRRADTLIRCGAEVIAVSPKFCDDFPKTAKRIIRCFRPEDLDTDLSLVIAATNSRDINRLIHDIAKSKSIPVNVADCQSECDFFFPSMINSGSTAVSVCTAGVSPSLTRHLSERLRKVWPLWVEEFSNKNHPA